METLQKIKEYRKQRDKMFQDLAETDYRSPEHQAVMDKIQQFDENHDHLIEERTVHAQSLNFGDIRRKLEHIPQDLGIDPHKIIDAVRGEFQHILQEAAAPVAKQAFQTSAHFAEGLYQLLKQLHADEPELIDDINKVRVPISLSVVDLGYSGFYNRAEGLTRLLMEQSQHFQFNRHSIRWVIENTGPSEIGVNIGAELFASPLRFSIGIEMPLSLAVKVVDLALEKAGVPE